MQFKTIQKFSAVILLLTISSAGFYACKKQVGESLDDNVKISSEINKVSVINANLIAKDVDYQNYISDFQNFLAKKKDEEAIKRFMKLTSLNQNEREMFAKAMGFNSSYDFENYVKKQNDRIKSVNTKYGLLNNSKVSITNFVETTLMANNTKSSQGKTMVVPGDGGDDTGGPNCNARRNNCLVIANVAAIAGHLACLAFDVTTVGIGAFICHGAVILGNSAANSNCLLDWEDCMNSNAQS